MPDFPFTCLDNEAFTKKKRSALEVREFFPLRVAPHWTGGQETMTNCFLRKRTFALRFRWDSADIFRNSLTAPGHLIPALLMREVTGIIRG